MTEMEPSREPLTFEERERVAEAVVLEAGQLIRDAVHSDTLVRHEKDPRDFVTELDVAIEREAKAQILAAFPGDSFAGEELERHEGSSGVRWVFDPIDGTNNFVRGIENCGSQNAIMEEERVISAHIYNPFTNRLYHAKAGEGAFMRDLETGEETRLEVSDRDLHDSMMIYDSGIAAGKTPSREIFNAMLGNVGWVRVYGAAVVDMPQVASGQADLLVTNIGKAVDIAPAFLLIKEAGGVVVDFDGNDWSLDAQSLVVGNNRNVDQALEVIARARGASHD